jgi:hypothetical protein
LTNDLNQAIFNHTSDKTKIGYEMILYHASKRKLPIGESLRTPTGRADGNIIEGGAIYLTDSPESCVRYGNVYKIDVSHAKSYKQALSEIGRTKKPRYTRGVYIAKPNNTKILGLL